MELRVDWRRVATGSVVLLSHILLILALLTTTGIVTVHLGNEVHEIMLTLPVPPRAKQKETVPLPVVPDRVPLPELNSLDLQSHSITVLPPPPQKETTPEGDIGILGRYLFNCSSERFEAMTEEERSHCLANKWEKGRQEKEPVLGTLKPSPYQKVIQERNAPFVPAFQGCDPSSVNASLHNVPCTNFSGGHDILQEIPGH